ncbi:MULTISPECIES: class I SAM-dependent DNA methyltransferase [Bacillus]|uniref:class I SAM-dependent DNA methyltransferase n=1 Tax=Bacillus TaxID=1386 RepID=UPI00031E252C|nr:MULTISPECIES: class I SAM-dependent methyltransferase [Bacillus]
MSYQRFAFVYDALMQDVPYEKWIERFMEKMQAYNIKGKKVLDVACGTGEFTIRLAEKGYNVTGVDLSEEMLAIAKVKADQHQINVPFFHQNMIELSLGDKFDSIVVFCDSLNYLEEEEQVQETFRQIYEHLNHGGLFMFDVHSIYKMEHIFANATFADVTDDVSYIWNSFEGKERYSVDHELTFFVKVDEESDLFERFEEDHYQRTYPIETFINWLQQIGFTVKEVLADLENHEPQAESERIMFVAVKE